MDPGLLAAIAESVARGREGRQGVSEILRGSTTREEEERVLAAERQLMRLIDTEREEYAADWRG
jgi:hypothetical protein